MGLLWDDRAWEEYCTWQSEDNKKLSYEIKRFLAQLFLQLYINLFSNERLIFLRHTFLIRYITFHAHMKIVFLS